MEKDLELKKNKTMKTPLEEAIKEISEDFNIEFNKDYINEFLEKEKQVIIDIYNWGLVNQIKHPHKNMNGVDYYNETFNK